ncbi:LLM class flavin-dependent oxidoreductase [Bdellovibrio sp. HCB185ZH]|uniref:LLM class flavin-dependent oxidoreductase n=1 Tax=Bdellovibrio sp. HCB185ZH TaxID=3394235 RepID=UPI0039A4B518
MKTLSDVKYSILDLASIAQGKTVADSFRNSLDLARHAEEWGFTRYWLAEHHNLEGIASSATSVLIGYIAGGTQTIRVGSGGIMLPNHAPLVIAEQFGTLGTLYPGRIDLGLGRAPGTDGLTMRALRRNMHREPDFGEQVLELQGYFKESAAADRVRAIPGAGVKVPFWILGSSLYSAQLAAVMGLPYAFAGHFAPDEMYDAVRLYRAGFQASEYLKEPYVMLGIQIVAADTDEKAQRLSTTVMRRFLGIIRNQRVNLEPPVDSMAAYWTVQEEQLVKSRLATAVIGGPETVQRKLQEFVNILEPDELMIVSDQYEHTDRLRSFELISQLMRKP